MDLLDTILLPPDWDSQRLLVLAGAVLAVVFVGLLIHRWQQRLPLRSLLGPLAEGSPTVVFFLRGLFVPGNELFSRAPEDPRNPASGLTVHKWGKIAELYSAQDVRAVAELLQLLLGANSRLNASLLSGEQGRQAWSEDAIAVGPHFKSGQILDSCEPHLVQVRQPAAIRSLVSPELFEPKDGLDFGLIYKGQHPASHRTGWVVTGLSDLGTAATARFLRIHARTLGQLMGTRPFAAVIAIDTTKGWEASSLRSLQPRPSWWRRFYHRRRWQNLTVAP